MNTIIKVFDMTRNSVNSVKLAKLSKTFGGTRKILNSQRATIFSEKYHKIMSLIDEDK